MNCIILIKTWGIIGNQVFLRNFVQGGHVHMKFLVHLKATVHTPRTGVDEAAGVVFVHICPIVLSNLGAVWDLMTNPWANLYSHCVVCSQGVQRWKLAPVSSSWLFGGRLLFCFCGLCVERGNLERQEKVTLKIRGKSKSLGKWHVCKPSFNRSDKWIGAPKIPSLYLRYFKEAQLSVGIWELPWNTKVPDHSF